MADAPKAMPTETRAPTEEEVDELLYSSRVGDVQDFRAVLQAILSRQPASQKADDSALDSVLNDVRLANEARNSPLHYACANGHAVIVDELLPRCSLSTLLSQNSAGNTPLHWAAFNGHLDVVRSLVDRIEALAQSDHRQTVGGAAPTAAKTEAEQDAEAEREAQRRSVWDVVNRAGRGPMSEAQMNNKEDVVEYLLQRMVTAPASREAETADELGERGDAVSGAEATTTDDLSRKADKLSVGDAAQDA